MRTSHLVLGALLTMGQITGYEAYIKGVSIFDACPTKAVEQTLLQEQAHYGAEATIVVSGAICKPDHESEDKPTANGVFIRSLWSIETDGTVGIHVDLQ